MDLDARDKDDLAVPPQAEICNGRFVDEKKMDIYVRDKGNQSALHVAALNANIDDGVFGVYCQMVVGEKKLDVNALEDQVTNEVEYMCQTNSRIGESLESF